MAFEKEKLTEQDLKELRKLTNMSRADILKMTTNANSGHPGGSMSSIDIYTVLWKFANINPKNFKALDRDRIIISHGHTSPGVYSILGNLGFFKKDEAIATFRKAGSIFEGHVERDVPGVEWGTGNLGQGLSAGCGMALAARINGYKSHIFVIMGDGENQKGQISEARRFASKYNLSNITAIIDYNKLQISGDIHKVMPQDLIAEYKSGGFDVFEINGHDFIEIYNALRKSYYSDHPTLILAHTIMGKGVSFMENIHGYHGKPLSKEQLKEALSELGSEYDLEKYENLRNTFELKKHKSTVTNPNPAIKLASARVYTEKTDNRSAFGNAVVDIAKENIDSGKLNMAVIDCDLAASVKTGGFAKEFPNNFFQSGIQEHHVATMSGALSTQGIVTFWADFGVFGIDETYNQARLNDINHTEIKIVCTHCGLDVGEDGKTHQCIDYVGLFRNLPHFKVIVPADPNQTDRAIKFAAKERGNFLIAMGRSKMEVLKKENGQVFFDEDYSFEYGKIIPLRTSAHSKHTIFAVGQMAKFAIEAYEFLKKEGIDVNVYSVSSPTEIDEEILSSLASNKNWITLEDHLSSSGFASTLSIYMAENGIDVRLKKLGVNDYSMSGNSKDLFKLEGLDGYGIAEFIREL